MGQDDTLIEDIDMHEQAMFELFKSGAVDGVKAVNFQELEQLDDEYMVAYEVPRKVVKYGFAAGADAFDELMECLPDKSRGSVVFTFSGFMGTNKPLFMEKEVVKFIRGFLFGSVLSPDIERAQAALDMLFDERTFAFIGTDEVVEPEAFNIAGGVWAVAHAFPKDLFLKDINSPSGWSRDMAANLGLYMCLCEKMVTESDIQTLLNAV